MTKVNEMKMEMRAELALMGKVVPCVNDEVQEITKYLLSAMGKDPNKLCNILEESIQRFSSKNEVKFIVCNIVMGMPCITYLIDTNEEGEPKPFEEDYGTGNPCSFCYVFNTESDWCSEFGDCFFEKKSDGYYHRIS